MRRLGKQPGPRLSAWASGTGCPFQGKVVAIADGDTITGLRDREQVRIRLHGIDCPEKGQPVGTRARPFTGEMAFGKDVSVREIDVEACSQ